MHPDERDVDENLVRRLIAVQFPHWTGLGLERVQSDGTDNAIYRLGADMAVRMPRYPAAVAQVEKETTWVPRLAPHLPLDVPLPLALGEPAEGYPWRWSVLRWVPGERGVVDDERDAAVRLAGFVRALQRVDPSGGPPPGEHNFGRGGHLATRDEWVRDALAHVGDEVDVASATTVWEQALAAPVWDLTPVWVHGDLHGGNMLVRDGRLAGVIDFGGLGVGDPAVDVMPAWTFFTADGRDAFRAELEVDDATWDRGRGWALWMGLIALPYYRTTNAALAASALRWIQEALSDRSR